MQFIKEARNRLEPPFRILGRWLGGWYIPRTLERTFAYRHETTRRLVKAAE